MIRDHFRLLLVDLSTGQRTITDIDGRNTVAGGSGLAAMLFEKYGILDKPWNEAGQPLIFAIGPLTGYFPLMNKTVCAFQVSIPRSICRESRWRTLGPVPPLCRL